MTATALDGPPTDSPSPLQLPTPAASTTCSTSSDAAKPVDNALPSLTSNAQIYHDLEHTWCLYLLSGAEKKTQESWSQSQTEVHRFSTVEDFWCMVTHIKPPSHIGISDYSFFKKGIKPEWEDPAVAQGGRWVAKFAVKVKQLDDIWLHVMMALIGETLHMTMSDYIRGAVVSMRPRSFKLSIWMAIRDHDFVAGVGRKFREILMQYLDAKESKVLDITFQSFTGHPELRLNPEGNLEEVTGAGSSAERLTGKQQLSVPGANAPWNQAAHINDAEKFSNESSHSESTNYDHNSVDGRKHSSSAEMVSSSSLKLAPHIDSNS